jgi:signal transduction histidine kinase
VNKNIFILFAILFSLASFSVSFFVGRAGNSDIIEKARVAIVNKSVSQLSKITESSTNDLLQGNIRAARNSISAFADSKLFTAFEVVKGHDVLDSSPDISAAMRASFLQVKTYVRYSEDGEVWGYVTYFISSVELDELEFKLSHQLLRSAFITSVLTLVSTVLIFLLFWISSSPLAGILQNYFTENEQESKARLITNIIWEPTLSKMSKFAVKFKEYESTYRAREIDAKFFELATHLAHDIRSPLSALQIGVRSIIGNEEAKEIILKVGDRIQGIANDLLAKPSLIDKGNKAVSVNRLNLSVIVSEIVAEKNTFCNVKISVFDDLFGKDIISKCDTTTVARIVSNLLNNAIESFAGIIDGKIDIYIRGSDNFAELTIIDTGCGISEEKILEVGGRGKTFNKIGGSGLGLFHAQSYLSTVGGKFSIQSTVGIGTMVRICVPKLD